MTAITTTAKLRKMNQQIIYQYIYKHKTTSKQAIADYLKLSLPTVAQNLEELETKGFVQPDGNFKSTGGRKAKAFTCVGDAKIAIGMAVTRKFLHLSALNLYGEVLSEACYPLPFENTLLYYQSVGSSLKQFLEPLMIPTHRVLGIGIGLQGLISNDGTTVTYGKILNCTGIGIQQFATYLPFPCQMIHDVEAAAIAELWYREDLENCLYLYLNHNLGGSIILNGNIHKGRNSKSGMFEHMTIVPGGRDCYCGKQGCLEAYCATDQLLNDDETLDAFFVALRNKENSHLLRWTNYLKHLALGIDNIHMVMDLDVILGGILTRYLEHSDLKELERLLSENTAFPFAESYVKTSICNTFEISKGAALIYVKPFLGSVSVFT